MGILGFIANFFVRVGEWLTGLLTGWGLSALWADIILRFIGSLVIVAVPFTVVLFLMWLARKVVGRIQDRFGPNNSGTAAGPYALLQSIADAIKILAKELTVPVGADVVPFVIAPMLIVAVALATWAVIPFGPRDQGMQGVDLNIGIFYVVSVSSLTLFSMIMGGWSSRNKYATLGAFRAVSQIVSYEIPHMLALLIPVMLVGSLSMQALVEAQTIPFIVALPIPALIYFLAVTAEIGRLPFEINEADAEIVAGYFVEYGGMMFGAFYLAEFINNYAGSLFFSVLFLGGWRGPFVASAPILGALWLNLKAMAVYMVFTFFWGAMPRLRIDQILGFNWKFLTPLALVTLMVLALVDKATSGVLAVEGGDLVQMTWSRAGWLFAANVVIAAGAYGVLTWVGKRVQRQQEARRLVVAPQPAQQQS